MEQDFLTNIPPEIMIDILSRLPARTTMSCKCVCKSWLGVIETPEFVKSHISKSVPGLALFQGETISKSYNIVEFVDELDPENSALHCNVAINFSFPHREQIHSSVNGLLFLCSNKKRPHNLFICNPITRDYVMLPPPKELSSSKLKTQLDTFGFGVSKLTCQYKVVRMFHECNGNLLTDPWGGLLAQNKCEVYTLGTGSWRRVAAGGPLMYAWMSLGVFLNGNLHWLVSESDDSQFEKISCFDLETELFSTFSIPHLDVGYCSFISLCALGDCLCLCDNSFDDLVIWLMNEYGDGKSWRKEFVIKKQCHGEFLGAVLPIKVFKDGDILMAREHSPKLYCNSGKTKSIQEIDVTESFAKTGTRPSIYSSSFLPLNTFAMENVSS